MRPLLRHASLVVLLALPCACSTLPHTGPDTMPPLRTYDQIVKDGETDPLNVPDPIEGFNRGAYRFNYYFDKDFLHPIVRGYEFILPEYAQDRISNALDNIGEFGNLTNNLLQLKLEGVGITLSRLLVNSTVGIAGLWDPATPMGLPRQTQDFGRTLAHYGVGSGSYVVLPMFGPSHARDTAGLAVDGAAFSLVGPIAWAGEIGASAGHAGLSAVDKRHRIRFQYRDTGSPFEYELLRMLYMIRRDSQVAEPQSAE